MPEYLPRIADALLKQKLEHSGAVIVRGPKWCGKTETSRRQAKSTLYMQDPDYVESNLQLAAEKPSLLLKGESPRLIDEWQMAPQLWDAVRFAIDKKNAPGQYILTGSATPAKKPAHSGTGRMSFLDMRPMTLSESNESSMEVSLTNLFSTPKEIEGMALGDVETTAFQMARGGWPGAVTSPFKEATLEIPFDYIEAVAENDISQADGVKRNPKHARNIMQAYARCVSTQAGLSTLSGIFKTQDSELSRPTFNAYIAALRMLYVIDDIPSWQPSLRAKARATATPKRFFCDPSLGVASMGASPELLLQDMPTFGMLFENMCIRDLKTYSQALHGNVFFYHDSAGAEADAVIVLRDGRWGLVEIKSGRNQVEDGANSLKKVEQKIDQTIMGAPSFLLVVTASGYAYRRKDGVYVTPLSCLTI